MDRATVEAAVRELYAARLSGDIQRIMTCFDPGAKVAVAGSPDACKMAIRVEGSAKVQMLVEGMVDHWEFLDQRPTSVLIDGNKAAVLCHATLRFRPDGRVIETDLAHFWEFSDGKVVSFVEFSDTAAINLIVRGH